MRNRVSIFLSFFNLYTVRSGEIECERRNQIVDNWIGPIKIFLSQFENSDYGKILLFVDKTDGKIPNSYVLHLQKTSQKSIDYAP